MHVWNFTPVWANADLLAHGLAQHAEGHRRGAGLRRAARPRAGADAPVAAAPGSRWPAGSVIEVFRTTPPLVQLFWFFFALPILIDVEMTPFVAAVLTFSIQSAAFFAEVFRGGIVSVERGQWERRARIGMSAAPGDAAHRAAAGGEAHDPGLPRARDRADEDHDAGRHRLLCRPAVPDQRDRAEDVPAARDLHRDGADLLRRDLRGEPARARRSSGGSPTSGESMAH